MNPETLVAQLARSDHALSRMASYAIRENCDRSWYIFLKYCTDSRVRELMDELASWCDQLEIEQGYRVFDENGNEINDGKTIGKRAFAIWLVDRYPSIVAINGEPIYSTTSGWRAATTPLDEL